MTCQNVTAWGFFHLNVNLLISASPVLLKYRCLVRQTQLLVLEGGQGGNLAKRKVLCIFTHKEAESELLKIILRVGISVQNPLR